MSEPPYEDLYLYEFLVFLPSNADHDDERCMESAEFLNHIDGSSDLYSTYEDEFDYLDSAGVER